MFPLIPAASRYVSGVTDPISSQSWSYSEAFVSEDDILALEREAFLSLLGTKETQQRIESMLKTGKPLRN